MEREFNVARRLRSAAERVFRNRPVLAAYAFGSRVSDYLQESLADLDDYARAIAGHDWE